MVSNIKFLRTISTGRKSRVPLGMDGEDAIIHCKKSLFRRQRYDFPEKEPLLPCTNRNLLCRFAEHLPGAVGTPEDRQKQNPGPGFRESGPGETTIRTKHHERDSSSVSAVIGRCQGYQVSASACCRFLLSSISREFTIISVTLCTSPFLSL